MAAFLRQSVSLALLTPSPQISLHRNLISSRSPIPLLPPGIASISAHSGPSKHVLLFMAVYLEACGTACLSAGGGHCW